MRAATRNECSEAGFSDFVLFNPQLDGHPDLIWQLRALYWRNAQLGHAQAIGLLIRYAQAWAVRHGERGIGSLEPYDPAVMEARIRKLNGRKAGRRMFAGAKAGRP